METYRTSQLLAPPRPATADPPAADRPAAGAHAGFRPDIEGLRAVAVLLVVLGHAGVAAFAGGYVGVDVFFVISGFLITSLLLRELRDTGRIRIAGFYARRAVRLLPAASLAVVATVAGAWLWLSPIRAAEYAKDAVASAGYVINLRLAVLGTDYLAAAEPPSPLQHFWSLAVEEQFYLVWPVLILAVTWAGRRRGRVRVGAVAAALVALTAASFALSVTETARSAPWAYFGPHTRAWELGVGALVALAAGRLARLPRRPAAALTWAGLAAIGAAAVLFDHGTAFPGAAAALPVAGAAFVIAGGCRAPAGGAGLLLDRGPMQTIGRLSYGWYLWHWPALIIGPVALGVPDALVPNLALCVVALVMAALSLRFVEDPVRGRRRLRERPAAGVGLGLALSASTAVVALVAAAMPPTLTTGAGGLDTSAAVRRADDPATELARLVENDAERQTVPDNLVPDVAAAKRDVPVSYGDGCHARISDAEPSRPCEYGDTTATTTVVLFGDSHAAQWLPALDRLGRDRRWRVVSLTKSSCGAAYVRVWEESLKRAYHECDTWRRLAVNRMRELKPDLVVVSSIVDDRRLAKPATDADAVWRAGWERTFGLLKGVSRQVALIGDTPHLPASVPDCVASQPTRIAGCTAPAAAALRLPGRRADVAAAATSRGVTVVDPVPWLCGDRCAVVIGNLLVYRDAHHLTTRMAETLAPLLGARLPDPAAG